MIVDGTVAEGVLACCMSTAEVMLARSRRQVASFHMTHNQMEGCTRKRQGLPGSAGRQHQNSQNVVTSSWRLAEICFLVPMAWYLKIRMRVLLAVSPHFQGTLWHDAWLGSMAGIP